MCIYVYDPIYSIGTVSSPQLYIHTYHLILNCVIPFLWHGMLYCTPYCSYCMVCCTVHYTVPIAWDAVLYTILFLLHGMLYCALYCSYGMGCCTVHYTVPMAWDAVLCTILFLLHGMLYCALNAVSHTCEHIQSYCKSSIGQFPH